MLIVRNDETLLSAKTSDGCKYRNQRNLQKHWQCQPVYKSPLNTILLLKSDEPFLLFIIAQNLLGKSLVSFSLESK